MNKIPETTLSNGLKMPMIGFGVFQVTDLEVCEQSVCDALDAGYRSIDTAASYMNEEAVGRAITRSKVPREQLFITTKLWVQDTNYEAAEKAFDTSLKKLSMDYVDLYLIHQPFNDYYGAWRAMEELYEQGKAKAIGVSNFSSDRLVDLMLNNKMAPMVNQIETHPFKQQIEARKIMDEYHVQHEGWAPFGEGRNDMFTNLTLGEIAASHGKTVAQVVLRWNIQRGVVAIPKSTHKERIQENLDIFNFELSAQDMEKIRGLDEDKGLFFSHADPEMVKAIGSRKIHD